MIRWLLFALLLAGDVALSSALTARADGVELAFFGALFGLIAAAFGHIASAAVTVAVTVAQVAIMIGQAVGQFALLSASVFARVFGFLRSFWSGVLRPFITWSAEQINRVAGWLRRTFEPIIRFLNDIRTEVQKIYDRWLRPIFDTIDATRRILQVLATLRVPFARELDRKLAEIEAFLLKPILDLYRLVNLAQDWINRIVTLDGLLQRLTLLRSVARDVGRIGAIWHAAKSRPVTTDDWRAAAERDRVKSGADITRESILYLETGQGPQAASHDEWLADLELRLSAR